MVDQVAAILQARTGSSRLPGKVLADLAGRPMLTFLVERLRRCGERRMRGAGLHRGPV